MDFISLSGQGVMERISRHCPQAMSAYLQCVNRGDENGHARFTRKQVEEEMSESWTLFRNKLKCLAREDLLSWSMNKPKDVITVIRPLFEEEMMEDEEDV